MDNRHFAVDPVVVRVHLPGAFQRRQGLVGTTVLPEEPGQGLQAERVARLRPLDRLVDLRPGFLAEPPPKQEPCVRRTQFRTVRVGLDLHRRFVRLARGVKTFEPLLDLCPTLPVAHLVRLGVNRLLYILQRRSGPLVVYVNTRRPKQATLEPRGVGALIHLEELVGLLYVLLGADQLPRDQTPVHFAQEPLTGQMIRITLQGRLQALHRPPGQCQSLRGGQPFDHLRRLQQHLGPLVLQLGVLLWLARPDGLPAGLGCRLEGLVSRPVLLPRLLATAPLPELAGLGR